MKDYEPKVGDRVSWFRGGIRHSGYREFGEVVRVTKATVFVKPTYGDERAFRRSKYGGYGLSKETGIQRARREWRAARPRTKHASVSFWRDDFEDVSIPNRITNADDARTAARELEAIAAWLDKRPEVA